MISNLVTAVIPSPYYSARTHVIDTITIHCMAQDYSIEKCGEIFQRQGKNASANYGIGSDGRIACYVDEDYRAWCSSNKDNDMRAINIEVASGNVAPYTVSGKAIDSLITLLTDICRRQPHIPRLLWRNDKSAIGNTAVANMTVHRWFANKACPGDFLMDRMRSIAEAVNNHLIDDIPPATLPTETMYRVQVGAFLNKDNAVKLRDELISKGYSAYIKEGVR